MNEEISEVDVCVPVPGTDFTFEEDLIKITHPLEDYESLFDKSTLELKGWKTIDSYSNNVNFTINELKINNQIVDNFFKIPKEEDL